MMTHSMPTKTLKRLAAVASIAAVTLLAVGPAAAKGPANAADDGAANGALNSPSTVTRPKMKATLVADVTAAAPGTTFRLGVRFEPDPHWHLYWKNPGETGLPTRITFGADDGIHFSEIRWPVPDRYVDKLGGVSYGYEKDVILYTDVRVPDNILAGASIQLTADAGWLVCYENCINGAAKLSLTLPIRDTAAANGPLFDAFEATAAMIPASPSTPGGFESLSVRPLYEGEPVRPGGAFEARIHVSDAKGRTLSVPDAERAFLPIPDAGLLVTSVRTEGPDDKGALTIIVGGKASNTSSESGDDIAGVVYIHVDGRPAPVETSIRIPRAAGPDVIAAAVVDPAAALARDGRDAGTPSMGAAGPACADVAGFAGAGEEAITSLGLALLFAFLGGVILNVMPCVLPVLSLKVLSLVEQAGEDKKAIWRHGLVYTAGVLASFGVLAGVMLALQAQSWAFQMQDPVFIAVFAAVVFALALSLFGVFEISMPGTTRMEGAVSGSKGYASSFNYGIFAVLLGTPCTAPMLGPAMTYAFTQPPAEMFLLLMTVGLGLAFPFLMLAAFPSWRRLLPRPGAWLITFKKAMAFLLVATAVYLLDTLSVQVSRGAFSGYLVFLTLMSLALWIYGTWASPYRSGRSRLLGTAVSLGVLVFAAMSFVSTEPPPAPPGVFEEGGISWHNFDLIDVEAEAAAGKTVFIDFTASWCVTCKVNESTAIYTDEVRAAIDQLGVMAVKADFTQRKESIEVWLKRFNQPSVPLYVVLPAGNPDKAFALPTLLSTDDILSGLCEAGPSRVITADAGL